MLIALVARLLLELANNGNASMFCGREAYFHG